MKKIAANLVVVLLATLVSFLLAEALSRIFLTAPQKIIIAAQEIVSKRPFAEKHTSSVQEHPDEGGLYRGSATGRRLKPNRIVTIENHRLSKQQVVIETNNIGYRNPPISSRKSSNKNAPLKQNSRILFLGDSVTFQDYLQEDQTFVRLVEKKALAEGKEWETINAGVGAISLKTELAILLESGLALEPDVVVLDFYLNDFQESKGVHIVTLPIWMERSWFLYHLSTTLQQMRGVAIDSKPQDSRLNLAAWKSEFKQRVTFSEGHFNQSPSAFNALISESFTDYGGAWSAGSWEYMQPVFEEFKRLSLEHHFKLVIVGFPVYPQVYTEFVDDYPQQQLRAMGKKLGIPVLDLLPPLRAEALRLRNPTIYQSEKFYADLFYDQCHHTPAGSKLIADEIYQFLNQNL